MTTTLATAYPLVVVGLSRLTAYVNMTPDVRTAFLLDATAEQLAELFLEAGDVHRLLFDHLYKEIDRAVRDRWLSNGDDRFADAVRAHARESDVTRQAVNVILQEVNATMPAARWKKQLAENEAYAEGAQRFAEQEKAKYAEAATSYKDAMGKLQRRLQDGLTVPEGMEEEVAAMQAQFNRVVAMLNARKAAAAEGK